MQVTAYWKIKISCENQLIIEFITYFYFLILINFESDWMSLVFPPILKLNCKVVRVKGTSILAVYGKEELQAQVVPECTRERAQDAVPSLQQGVRA